MDTLVEALNKLTINDAVYYESDSANAKDTKVNPTSDPNTATHTSDGKKRKVTETSNGYLQQKLLSNRTLPIITITIDPQTYDRISTCSGTPHTIVTHLMKEFITDAARSSARVLWTPKHVIHTGRVSTTPGNTPHAVRSPQTNSPVLIGGIGVYPASGLSGSLQVFNKRQSAISDKIWDTQKLDTSVDIKFPNDWYSTSIFRKLIGREISHGSSADIYLRCWMDFASDVVQTEAPYFLELGLSAVNTSDEVGIFDTPTTIIRRPKDGSHWSAPDFFLEKQQ